MKNAVILGLEPFWFETYACVVRTGEPIRFESYLQAWNKWFDVYVTPINAPQDQQFAVLFRDITDRRRATLNAEFLATVRDDLAEITEVGDIVQMVGDRLHRYLNISSCAFVEINERADEAVIYHHWHQSHVPSLVGVYALRQFVAEDFLHTAQAGQPIVVRNVAADPRIVDPGKFAALSIGAELNIPLIRDGEWKFSLTVYHPVPYDWRDDEIALMQELASRIWTKLERARADAALRDSRAELERQVQKFDATLSTITDSVFSFDRTGRFLYANQVLLDLWGVTAAEAIGKTMADLNYPTDVEQQVLDDLQRVLETGERVRTDTSYTSPAGVDGYFEYILSPVFAADRTVELVVGLSRDISDRIQAETVLRESEQRFRRIFECEMVPMGIYTPAGGIVEANNSLLNLIGYTRQELETGQISWQALTPPKYRAMDEFAVNEVATRGVSTPYEKVYLHKDGREIPILIGAALLLEDGSSGVFFAIDLSERKKVEAELRESESRY